MCSYLTKAGDTKKTSSIGCFLNLYDPVVSQFHLPCLLQWNWNVSYRVIDETN
jgi:hypothetical protein